MFLFVPTQIFLGNKEELGAGFALLVPGSVALIFLLLIFGLRKQLRGYIWLFYGTAIYIGISDLVLSPGLSIVFGGIPTIEVGIWDIVVDLFVITLTMSGSFFLFRKFDIRGSLVSGIIIVAILGLFGSSLFYENFKEKVLQPPQAILKNKPNIFHLIFDSLSGHELRQIFDENPELRREFSNFHIYFNALSNYQYTQASVVSTLTGKLLEEQGGSFADFREAYRNSSILNLVRNKGYTVHTYIADRRFSVPAASFEHSHDTVRSSLLWFSRGYLLLNYSLVRVTPTFLKRVVQILIHRLNSFFSIIFPKLIVGLSEHENLLFSYEQFEQLKNDLKIIPSNSQYIYAYFLHPHSPFILNSEGRYVGERKGDEESVARKDQIIATIKQIVSFLKMIKDSGHDGSQIIIHGDHGAREHEKFVVPEGFVGRGQIIDKNPLGYDYELVLSRSNPIVLIYFPEQKNRVFKENDLGVQLLDLFPSVLGANGWSKNQYSASSLGKDLYDKSQMSKPISLSLGYRFYSKAKDEYLYFGRTSFENTFYRYEWTQGKEWVLKEQKVIKWSKED